MEDKDFIGQIFKQNCGDSLKVLKKTIYKNKNGNYLFECNFLKYPFSILSGKREILKGTVNNPQIEQVEFIDKLWPQNCGDTLKIIKKSDKKDKSNHHYLYECEFVNYPIKILALKGNITKGSVLNPIIAQKEEDIFFNKTWKQNCGDSLKILEKTKNQTNNKEYLYRAIFIKYPYEVYKTKSCIKEGSILNPLIEENEFIGHTFEQKNKDVLKVLRKTTEKRGKDILFECQFLEGKNKILTTKGEILRGALVNQENFIWNYRDKLEEYLKSYKNFPTLQDLAIALKITPAFIGQKIKEFNLEKYIKYYENIQEKDLKNFINQYVNIEENKYFKIENTYLEVDIYIPSLQIGFEYNGNFWHSDHPKFGKVDTFYHQNKSLKLKEKGIRIIHIWEWEWEDQIKHPILEFFIKSKLGIFNKKIGASKCKIKEIDSQTYSSFCEENHLQGACGAKVKLGLFYKEELIQVMSFGVPRFSDSYEWEIIRECSKQGYCIIGGKEKLWSYFIKKYNPKSVLSYCDFSKFIGDSYLKLGFKKERLNKPGFVWWDKDKNKIYLRTPWKNQEMKEKNYLKLYDAGQLVFSWINNKS